VPPFGGSLAGSQHEGKQAHSSHLETESHVRDNEITRFQLRGNNLSTAPQPSISTRPTRNLRSKRDSQPAGSSLRAIRPQSQSQSSPNRTKWQTRQSWLSEIPQQRSQDLRLYGLIASLRLLPLSCLGWRITELLREHTHDTNL
jgi:hypothetical protein